MLQILDVVCNFGGSSINIPDILPNVVHIVVLVIKVAIPIGLVIFGMLDLGKAVMASKEDEIKKAQQLFIKRIIAAVLVFFVVSIVQLVFSVLASADSKTDPTFDGKNVTSCMNCFLSGADSKSCSNAK